MKLCVCMYMCVTVFCPYRWWCGSLPSFSSVYTHDLSHNLCLWSQAGLPKNTQPKKWMRMPNLLARCETCLANPVWLRYSAISDLGGSEERKAGTNQTWLLCPGGLASKRGEQWVQMCDNLSERDSIIPSHLFAEETRVSGFLCERQRGLRNTDMCGGLWADTIAVGRACVGCTMQRGSRGKVNSGDNQDRGLGGMRFSTWCISPLL